MKYLSSLLFVFHIGAYPFFQDYDHVNAKPICKRMYTAFVNSIKELSQADRAMRVNMEDDKIYLNSLLKSSQSLENLGFYMKSGMVNNCFSKNEKCQRVLNNIVKQYKVHSEINFKILEIEKTAMVMTNKSLNSQSYNEAERWAQNVIRVRLPQKDYVKQRDVAVKRRGGLLTLAQRYCKADQNQIAIHPANGSEGVPKMSRLEVLIKNQVTMDMGGLTAFHDYLEKSQKYCFAKFKHLIKNMSHEEVFKRFKTCFELKKLKWEQAENRRFAQIYDAYMRKHYNLRRQL